MNSRPNPREDRPRLQLEGLADLVASDTSRAVPVSSYRKPREVEGGGIWRFYFAGWMGLMFGPVPIGHLALGLVGLYFKLR